MGIQRNFGFWLASIKEEEEEEEKEEDLSEDEADYENQEFRILIVFKVRVIHTNSPRYCAIIASCTQIFQYYHSCPPKILKTYKYAPSITIRKKIDWIHNVKITCWHLYNF